LKKLFIHTPSYFARVIGVPDPIMGEELKAFYSIKNPINHIDEEE